MLHSDRKACLPAICRWKPNPPQSPAEDYGGELHKNTLSFYKGSLSFVNLIIPISIHKMYFDYLA